MDHATRTLYVMGVFDSFTYTLSQILPPVPRAKRKGQPAPTDPVAAERASLAEFRKSFSGRTWGSLNEAKASAWLTPDSVTGIFRHLDPVIARVVKIVPTLAGVKSPTESLPSGADNDNCAAFDTLLAKLADYTVEVRFHYWRQYRTDLVSVARAEHSNPVAAMADVAKDLETFCSHARSASRGNDEVFGALVEEFIRRQVAAAVHPLEVSTGGITGLGHMTQLDCIIWDRSAAPPIVEAGNVAIVSPVAARAAIEVKSCCDTTLSEFSHRIMRLHAEGSVLQDVYGKAFYTQALGIVVWTDYEPARFGVMAGNTILPLYFRSDDNHRPNEAGFQALAHFLGLWGRPSSPGEPPKDDAPPPNRS